MKKLLVFVFLIAIAGNYANAGENLKLSVSEDYKYDSNIYKVASGRTSSLIRVTRGMAQYNTVLPNTPFKLNSGAMFGYNAYNKYSNTNNSIDSLISLGLKSPNMEFSEKFLFTSDAANNADDDREKRWKNTVSASFKTKKAHRLWLKATLTDSVDEYVNLNTMDRNTLSLSLRGYYSHSEKTDMYVGYKFTNITYQDNGKQNSGTHAISAGMEGRIAPKVIGDFDVFYSYRDYHKSANGYKDSKALLGLSLGLKYEMTERTFFNFDASRQTEETAANNANKNRYFVDTSFSVTANHKLSSRSTASLKIGWDNLDYDKKASGQSKARNDNLYVIRPSFSHKINSVLSGSAFVEYKTRHSNITNRGYDLFMAGIGMRALF